jgi:membrane protease YdiL (CAAX protease family)
MNVASNHLSKQWWGFWSTLGFSFLLFVIINIINTALILYFVFTCSYQFDTVVLTRLISQIATDGKVILYTTMINAFISILFLYLVILIREGQSFIDYIGIKTLKLINIFYLFLALIIYIFTFSYLSILLTDTNSTKFIDAIYKSNVPWYLITFNIVIVAPIYEEFLFRGFLFNGILHSKFGPIGAVLFSSIAWAIIHVQYDWFGIISILFLGLILGFTKLKTNSIIYCIIGHMFINLMASLEVLKEII